jgi:hypothetical protein
MMERVRTSETSVYLNETTRRNIPEGCHLHILSSLQGLCLPIRPYGVFNPEDQHRHIPRRGNLRSHITDDLETIREEAVVACSELLPRRFLKEL